jgi:hypothetical protein
VTIAVSVRVNDGVVLAADSATTLMGPGSPDGGAVLNVYNNANKVFNLRKGSPIGLMTWGLGNIGGASISTLAKDLRERLTAPKAGFEDWHLDPDNYQMSEVANLVHRFFYDELYKPAADAASAASEGVEGADSEFSDLGLLVAGYSTGEQVAEEFSFNLTPSGSEGPTPLNVGNEAGLMWAGQPEAISRLVNGHSPSLAGVLVQHFGLPADQQGSADEALTQHLSAGLLSPAMPLQDAVDLAEFFVDLSIKWARFSPGTPSVGSPIELAAISKHEGFKWVRRKHYFDARLNP